MEKSEAIQAIKRCADILEALTEAALDDGLIDDEEDAIAYQPAVADAREAATFFLIENKEARER